jgi:gas vesicle protein
MAVITVPKVLREKLGEDGADTLVELINLANQKVKEDVIELSAEKFERRLTEEMAKVNQRITDEVAKLDKRITEEIAKVNQRITDEVANLRGEIKDEMAKLDNKISDVKVDLIKWQVGMFVTTVILILGLYATIIFK